MNNEIIFMNKQIKNNFIVMSVTYPIADITCNQLEKKC